MIRKLLYSFLFFITYYSSFGQTIWNNPIAGNSTASPYTSTGQIIDPNISVSGISRGGGLTGTSANGSYSASGWSTNNSIGTTDYFEFSLSPNAGREIDFLNFVYASSVSVNGSWTIALRSSVDNFAANIGTGSTTGGTISLAGASFQNIESTITFRIYVYNSPGNSRVFNLIDFQFRGNIGCGNVITATGNTICQGGSGTISYGVGSTSLSGNTLTGSWNLATDPVAYRPGGETTGPFNDTSTCLFISSEAKRSYVATSFQVSVTGNYTFKMTDSGAYDGIGYIYTGNFTPGDCAGGGTFVRGDDDDGAIGTEPKMVNVPLTAGTTYTLISTQFNLPAVNANFVWTITPPSGGGLITPSWYSTATSTTPISSASPFNPVGVAGSGLIDTNTPGTKTYYVSFPSVVGCRTAVDFVINPLPTISGALGVCVGFTTQLTGSATAAASTPWTSGTPTVATVSNTGLVTAVAVGTSVITYKNSNGCTQTATVTVSALPTPSFTAQPGSTSCIGADITYTTQALMTNYIWTIPGTAGTNYLITSGGTVNDNSVTLKWLTPGSRTISVNYTNTNGCTAASAVSSNATTVNDKPTIILNKTDEICASSNNGTITPVLSGGLTNVRYIKLTQKYVNAAAWQQVAEIQAFEIFTGTNVALAANGASATASSTYSNNPSVYGAQRAIDGLPNSFWHSATPNINEYIIVDLASAKNLDYLRIYNREDCCQERGQNMLLELLDASNNVIYSKTVDLFENISGPHYIDVNVLNVSWGDPASTLNRTGLDVGTYTLNYSDAAGCSTSSQVTIATTNANTSITTQPSVSAICAGSNTSFSVAASGAALTYQWEVSTDGGTNFGTLSNGGVYSGVASATMNITGATTLMNGYRYRVVVTGTCSAVTSPGVALTVNSSPTVTSIATPTALCVGGSLNMTTPTATANGSAIISQGWQIETGVSSGAYTSFTLPYTVALADDGKTIRYSATSSCGITTSNSVTLKVNDNPTAPVASPTQPTCAQPTGTITVSSPAPGAGISYGLDGTTFPNTNGVFTGLTNGVYTIYVKNGSGCIASGTPITIASTGAIVWTGNTSTDWNTASNWLPAVVPALGDCVVIPNTGVKNSVISTDVSVHSISVNNGGSLTVLSDKILTVTEGIIVGTSGSFVFENNSSLIQKSTSNSINIGNITYKRKSAPVRRYDFTFWSSPVKKESVFTLKKLSPLTLADKYYSYNTTTLAWKINNGGTLTMNPGDGYIVRAPQNYNLEIPAIYPASFIGTPNNGDIEITPVADHSYLLGNPYPSALNAKEFIEYNSRAGNDVGALYFWTHNSLPSDTVLGDAKYNYTVNDYAVYSLVGGTATGPAKTGGSQPTGVIAAGQAFFATPSTNVKIKFTNDMRIGAGNSQFFKTKGSDETEQNRLWLNFTNAKGAFKQVLVGYVDGATNGWDANYDGWTMSGNTYVDFYSINDAAKLTIQGRALPFEKTDFVPLGYVTTIAGDFTIAIDHGDGVFTNQGVYLEDKKTGKITDLRASNYTFTTAIGTFTDRFVLRYTNKTLGTGDFENVENGILVSAKDKTIKVQSFVEMIKEVTIFDVAGKLVYNKKKVTSNELQITNLQAANQVLLINITLENGFTTTRKVIFQ